MAIGPKLEVAEPRTINLSPEEYKILCEAIEIAYASDTHRRKAGSQDSSTFSPPLPSTSCGRFSMMEEGKIAVTEALLRAVDEADAYLRDNMDPVLIAVVDGADPEMPLPQKAGSDAGRDLVEGMVFQRVRRRAVA